jgi:hypothetical protein
MDNIRNIKILVTDDDEDDREFLPMQLRISILIFPLNSVKMV